MNARRLKKSMTLSGKSSMTLFQAVTSANPKSYPAAPFEFVKFKEWDRSEDAKRSDYEDRARKKAMFYNQQFVRDYIESLYAVQAENRSAFLWLLDYKNNYATTDAEIRALDIKIGQFVKFFGDQKQILPALRLDLSNVLSGKENKQIEAALNELINA